MKKKKNNGSVEIDVSVKTDLTNGVSNASGNTPGELLTQIPYPPKKEKKRSTFADVFQICLLSIFGSVFIGCIIYLGISYYGKIQGGEVYGNIANEFAVFDPESNTQKLYLPADLSSSDAPMQTLDRRISSGNTDSNEGTTDDTDRLAQIKSSISSLKAMNPDTYGWIFVNNTDINYPIAQGTDNEYYLSHSIQKGYLAIGTVFADYNCKEVITDNLNTVFYGHNVVTNIPGSSMFHDVTKFLDRDFFESTFIYVYTPDGIYTYKPFSIYSTTSDQFYFQTVFANDEEFVKFAADAKSKSRIYNDIEITADDTIITLSTCTNGPQNERYALHAVLIDSIT